MKRLQVSVAPGDARYVEELARRLGVTGSAAARLLLRAGLELARRDPAVLLAAPEGETAGAA